MSESVNLNGLTNEISSGDDVNDLAKFKSKKIRNSLESLDNHSINKSDVIVLTNGIASAHSNDDVNHHNHNDKNGAVVEEKVNNHNHNDELIHLNDEGLLIASSTSNNNNSSRTASPLNGEGKRFHRVVFTGGPCAGKTTSIIRIRNFFQNIGWKVFIVPETATLLLGSGIRFYDLNDSTRIKFQENLLKTLLQIEDTINDTAKYYHNERHTNVLVIYDRGAMDPVSFLKSEEWESLKIKNPSWNEVDLRDNRYDQIIHLITAANGAEQFYTLDNNVTRTESIEVAREIDDRCSKAWVGHPCLDCIDNCTQFEMKVTRTLKAVCARVGLNLKGLGAGNKKRKFLVKYLPDDSVFPSFQEVNVVHNYLTSNIPGSQGRIRKSGQSGVWSYSYAIRNYDDDQMVETRTQVDRREYAILMKTIDPNHWTIYQKRRCFIWNRRYFRLEIYEEPCNPSCRDLILLTTRSLDQDLTLPDFIPIEKEVTNDENYSMFNLSKKNK